MRTLLPDPPPAEFAELLERRHRWGADRRDEVWEGVLHMNPAPQRRHAKLQAQLLRLVGPVADSAALLTVGEFNLGEPDDYRVPDGALDRPGPDLLWNPTAAPILEVVSPGGETWEKLPFELWSVVLGEPLERAGVRFTDGPGEAGLVEIGIGGRGRRDPLVVGGVRFAFDEPASD